MFGYVKPVAEELLVKDYEFYRATYCGICRSMKKHTGALSNMTLSYDSVLLALVRMLYIPDSEISAKKKRCIAHPMKKRCMLNENSATEYTARAFAILTYHKVLDDIADEGLRKRMILSTAKPIVASGAKRADIKELSKIISEKLHEIRLLEEKKTASVDEPASLFGELLGEVFSHGLSGDGEKICREFGYRLGRFIYAADAAEDYEEDRVTGKYNPYVLLYGANPLTYENKQSIKCALICECRGMEAAVNLMPFNNRYTIENIIKNIIYLGLIKRIDFLDGNAKEENENMTSSNFPEQE